MPEALEIAARPGARWLIALAVVGGTVPAQDPGAAAATEPTAAATAAIVERLADHFERCERASYGCRFTTASLTLVDETQRDEDPASLRGTEWSHLEPILAEFANRRPDASPPPPVVDGFLAFARGAWTLSVANRTYGPPTRSAAYYDGQRTLQLRTSGHATLWERATECDVNGLPWAVLKLGDRSLALLLRAAAADGSLSALLETGEPGTVRAALPAPLLGVPFRVAVTAELRGAPARVAVTQLEICRGDQRVTTCAVHTHRAVDGVLLPERYTLTTALPGAAGLALAHAIAVDYGQPGPDPAAILALAATSRRIGTLRTNVLPVAGLDRAMAAAAAGAADPPALALEPERVAVAADTWPNLAAWLAAEQRGRRFLTTAEADQGCALPIAAAMCARWAGKQPRLLDVLAMVGGEPLAVEQAAQLLRGLGLDYAPVEASLPALAGCRAPFVVLALPDAGLPTAHAMRIAAGKLLVWHPSRGAEAQLLDALDDATVTALVDRADRERLRRPPR